MSQRADILVTPGYALGDLMLGYTRRHWDVTLNVRNATDQAYLATCLARGDCFGGERRSAAGRVVYPLGLLVGRAAPSVAAMAARVREYLGITLEQQTSEHRS